MSRWCSGNRKRWDFRHNALPPLLRQVVPTTDDQARLLAWGAGRIAVVPWIKKNMWIRGGLGIINWDPHFWCSKTTRDGDLTSRNGDLTCWAWVKSYSFHHFFGMKTQNYQIFWLNKRVLRWTEPSDHCKVKAADSTFLRAYVSELFCFEQCFARIGHLLILVDDMHRLFAALGGIAIRRSLTHRIHLKK